MIKFDKTNNIAALPPYTLNNPKIIVNPGESDILVFFMTDTPSYCQFKMIASFHKNDMNLFQLIMKNGLYHDRLYKQREVGIGMII